MSSPRPREHGASVTSCQAAEAGPRHLGAHGIPSLRQGVIREPTKSMSTTSAAPPPALVVHELRLITVGSRFQMLVISEAPWQLHVLSSPDHCVVPRQHGWLIGAPAWQPLRRRLRRLENDSIDLQAEHNLSHSLAVPFCNSLAAPPRPTSPLNFQLLACRALAVRWLFRLASTMIGEPQDNGDAVAAVVGAV
jgi:hypothetical protein